jgi:hypothetical protein
MGKFGIAVAVTVLMLIGGLLSWKAEATTAVGSNSLPTMLKQYSVIEKAACGGWGKHCPPGFVWTCRPNRCWCARC